MRLCVCWNSMKYWRLASIVYRTAGAKCKQAVQGTANLVQCLKCWLPVFDLWPNLTLYSPKAVAVPRRIMKLVHWPLMGGLLHFVIHVKPIQFYYYCLPGSMLIAMRKILFWKMFYHNNIVQHYCCKRMESCSSVFANSTQLNSVATADIYNIGAHHIVHLNNFTLWNLFWSHFTDLIINSYTLLLAYVYDLSEMAPINLYSAL